MSLRVTVLASGSKGNCIHITDGASAFLVDLGLSYSELKQRAYSGGIDLSAVSAVLNTHCHTDHCKGIETFLNRHRAKVFTHKDGAAALSKSTRLNRLRFTEYCGEFYIGDILIEPFKLSHDAPCWGYKISAGNSVSIATDLGTADDAVLKNMEGCGLVIIESNHDLEMLKNGPYPYMLKKRILSQYGHLSNDASASVIERLIRTGTKNFILAHLSEENNLPELAYGAVAERLKAAGHSGFSIDIAHQYKCGKTHII